MPQGIYKNKVLYVGFWCFSNLLSMSVAFGECNCIWQGSFVDVQKNADLIVSGSVIATKGNSIDLNIERTLRGKSYREEIRIWLKTKNYCRPEPDQFPLGSRWVMALERIKEDIPGGFDPNTPNISYGRVDDFILSSCGGYWLSQQGETVTGNLLDGPRWARDPKTFSIDLDILFSYIDGKIAREDLAQYNRENPVLEELLLDTRIFLKKESIMNGE